MNAHLLHHVESAAVRLGSPRRGLACLWLCGAAALLAGGCGTTREKQATDQMLLSDAVDRAVANIDFTPLAGETVFLDTVYLNQVKGSGFVNADYIISSLRQQMVLAGCLLQTSLEQADYVAEARVGALGSDGHDVNYGVPGSTQGIAAAASLVGGTPVLPSLPEVSLARKAQDSAAAKIAVFAYHRASRRPVWQSGLSVARSTAQSRWFMGAGPFQDGSIYQGRQLAGSRFDPTPLGDKKKTGQLDAADLAYRRPAIFEPRLREKGLQDGGDAPQVAEGASGIPSALPDGDLPPAAGEAPLGDGRVQHAGHVEPPAP